MIRTDRLRAELSALFKDLEIKSVLDIPCGDFNWMHFTEMPSIEYVGADIVLDLVRENSERYVAPGRRFLQVDILSGPLPKCDLILCRDGLVHVSFRDITRALRVIKESGATYLLVTTFVTCRENRDVATGDWHPLNLERPPLSFPRALRILPDGPLSNGTFADKSLALYGVQDLPNHVSYNRNRAAWQRTHRRLSLVISRMVALTRRVPKRVV